MNYGLIVSATLSAIVNYSILYYLMVTFPWFQVVLEVVMIIGLIYALISDITKD